MKKKKKTQREGYWIFAWCFYRVNKGDDNDDDDDDDDDDEGGGGKEEIREILSTATSTQSPNHKTNKKKRH